MPSFALKKDLERLNITETGNLKKRDMGGRKELTPG